MDRPDGRRFTGRRRLALVFVLVFLAQAVVLYAAFFPAPHNGGDNAGYLTLAHSLLERGAYLELWDPEEPPHTKYPPVFPLILAGAMLLGASSWTAFKALSLAFASTAVLLTFAWARERRGLAFAAAVALLFALSDALIWASYWILSEPPFLALTLLALWSFQRAAGEGPPIAPGASVPERSRWLWIGCGAAILAYFTRSAGLPLVVAVALWMAGRRRWRPLAIFLAAFGIPAFLWWMRTRLLGDATYVAEFWMVNPYDPAAGRAGVAELAQRIARNFHLYVGTYFPGGLIGLTIPFLTGAGYLLFLAALGGWFRRLRRRATVAEFFVPLYFGLILLWPVVWSGDRFALPLYPLLIFYAGDFLVDGARSLTERVGKVGWSRPAGLVTGWALVLLLAAPAFVAWRVSVERATHCSAMQGLHGGDPFGCYGGPTGEFVSAARWSGEQLPEGAVVFSRKPRLFYVLSGVKSRMYPLSTDPDRLAGAARAGQVEYLLVDDLDDVSATYLVPLVHARPDAFCTIAAWGRPGEVRTELLGITLPALTRDGEGGRQGLAEDREEGRQGAAEGGEGGRQGAAEVGEQAGSEGEGVTVAPEWTERDPQGAAHPDGPAELRLRMCSRDVIRAAPLPPSLPLGRVPLLEGRRAADQSSPRP